MAVDSAQYRVTPRSIILRGVKLCAVSYCAELFPPISFVDSAQYETARSQVLADFFYSAQYDTPRSQSFILLLYCAYTLLVHIRIVLHIVSFDSDEIETSNFF